MTTAKVNLVREFGKLEPVEPDTPGYEFSGKHLACPRSHAILSIEVNSDDLIEVENITKAAVAADFPGWRFNYLKVEAEK